MAYPKPERVNSGVNEMDELPYQAMDQQAKQILGGTDPRARRATSKIYQALASQHNTAAFTEET